MLKTQTPSEPVFQTAFNQINKESKMNPRYAPMFAPNTLNNGVAIKNRFVVAPLTIYPTLLMQATCPPCANTPPFRTDKARKSSPKSPTQAAAKPKIHTHFD